MRQGTLTPVWVERPLSMAPFDFVRPLMFVLCALRTFAESWHVNQACPELNRGRPRGCLS